MAAVPGIDPAWRWKQPAEPFVNKQPETKAKSLLTSDRKEYMRRAQTKWRSANLETNRQRARDGMRKRRAELKDNAS